MSIYLPTQREEISQGDIIENIRLPHITFNSDNPSVKYFSAPILLLTHDCEYDKPNLDFVLVTDVRGLAEVNLNSRGNIRHFKTVHTYYLEEIPGRIPESYVSFRRIFRIPKNFVAHGQRIASLNDEARLALQRQLAIFFGHER